MKVPQGVTKLCPGSYAWMTGTATPVANLMLAGDHIRHGHGSHGARGLSQEKALVTGYLAAAACARDAGIRVPRESRPLDVEPDEAHICGTGCSTRSQSFESRLEPILYRNNHNSHQCNPWKMMLGTMMRR